MKLIFEHHSTLRSQSYGTFRGQIGLAVIVHPRRCQPQPTRRSLFLIPDDQKDQVQLFVSIPSWMEINVISVHCANIKIPNIKYIRTRLIWICCPEHKTNISTCDFTVKYVSEGHFQVKEIVAKIVLSFFCHPQLGRRLLPTFIVELFFSVSTFYCIYLITHLHKLQENFLTFLLCFCILLIFRPLFMHIHHFFRCLLLSTINHLH